MSNFDDIKIVPSVLVVKACATDDAIVSEEELQLDEGKSIAELLQNFIGSRSRKIFGLVVLNHFTSNSIHFFYKVI